MNGILKWVSMFVPVTFVLCLEKQYSIGDEINYFLGSACTETAKYEYGSMKHVSSYLDLDLCIWI